MTRKYYDEKTNCNVIEEEIGDVGYFNMIDNQVRSKFVEFEKKVCLPAAKMLYAGADIPDLAMFNYPVEGYYSKSPELTELFQRVRNIQQNPTIYRKINEHKQDNMLSILKAVYENDLMGTEPTAFYPWKDSPIKRRYDILTLATQDTTVFDDKAERPWDIPSIMAAVEKKRRGIINLVELASMTGDVRCLCAGAESNSLGRMFGVMSGSYSCGITRTEYIWKVSPGVQALGEKIVNEYNKLIGENWTHFGNIVVKGAEDISLLIPPSLDNVHTLKMSFELPRVAHIGFLRLPKINYFWVMNWIGVKDVYTRHFLVSGEFDKYSEDLYDYWKSSDAGVLLFSTNNLKEYQHDIEVNENKE